MVRSSRWAPGRRDDAQMPIRMGSAAAALAAIVMAGCANTVNPANTDGRRVTLTSAGDDMA